MLFIFVDDMTYNGVASLGDRDVKTPNIDRLVRSESASLTPIIWVDGPSAKCG